MLTPTSSNETQPQANEAKDPGELSFSEYEAKRRAGEKFLSSESSAPEHKQALEQNDASESETEGKEEAKEEAEDESDVESESDEDADDTKDAEKDKPKKKSGYKRRIEKLVSQRETERRRVEELEARLARIESGAGDAKSSNKSVPEKAETAGKPNPDNFENHVDYVEALTDWKLEQREKAARAEQEKSRLKSEQENLVKAHIERVQSFAKKTEDFQEVLEGVDDVRVSAAVEGIILSSENGPELMYELAKNRAEFERVNKLPPTLASFEIGKLAAKLAAPKEQPKPEPKKLTQAPKPIAPVGKATGAVQKSPEDMSYSEYERYRREQMKRRG